MVTPVSINMDRRQRIVIDTRNAQWQTSPAKGVWRKPLEREAAETGQVTSIVRYDANTHFPPHDHPAGEEILVLQGVFQDEHGDYPAGTYIRNPPGYYHSPGSTLGCELLVKLNMFAPDDNLSLRIDTHNEHWQPGLEPGLSVLPLHGHNEEQTALIRWEPDSQFSFHKHASGEEVFVLSGSFDDEFGHYSQGTWLRNPASSAHQPFSREGCLFLLKTGHLKK